MTAPHFVRTACTLGLFLAVSSCASTPSTPSSNGLFQLDVSERVVSFAITDLAGMPVEDFLKLGQQVTGKVFTYTKTDLEQTQNIRFVGTVKMKREEFFSFMQTMLRIRGLACVPNGSNTSIVNVRKLALNGKPEVKSQVIKLEHADGKQLVATLRKLNEGADRGSKLVVVSHHASNALLLSGPPKLVSQAKNLIVRLDVPKK